MWAWPPCPKDDNVPVPPIYNFYCKIMSFQISIRKWTRKVENFSISENSCFQKYPIENKLEIIKIYDEIT